MRVCLHVYMRPLGRAVFSMVQFFSMGLMAQITKKAGFEHGSFASVCSPRTPLDEDAVHDSFNQLIKEHSQIGAPSEAFELQELQRQLSEESQGIPPPSCSLNIAVDEL